MFRRIFASYILLLAANLQAQSYVSSIWPLKFLCEAFTENAGDCGVLVNAGLSPHTFEPRPSQIKVLKTARLVLSVGPGIDSWMEKLPTAAHRIVLLKLLPREQLLAGSHVHHENEAKDKHADVDPHFWLDPTLMRAAVEILLPKFCEVDKARCPVFTARALKYREHLQRLEQMLLQQLSQVKDKPFLIYHPFLDYFVRRFQLRQVGKIEPYTGREPTPQYLKQILDKARAQNVKTLVSSPQMPDRASQIVASAAKMRVVLLDDIGGTLGRSNYHDLMNFNGAALVQGLNATP